MSRQDEELQDMSEARRQSADEIEEIEVDSQPDREEKSSNRSEGLDTLKSYLREVRRSTLLTFKQEQELGKRVQAGDEQARQIMIESNLRLVISIGKRYMQSRLSLFGYCRGRQSWTDQGRGEVQL